MMESFMEALVDTGKLVPLLAAAYFVVAFLEYRYGSRMGEFMASFGQMGPLVGAFFGCIPQCGFSVLAAALYVKRVISPGTLLAVFISTSDEAVPVLLSMPDQAGMVGTLVSVKVVLAVIVGVSVDLFLNKGLPSRKARVAAGDDPGVVHEHCGCCSHGISDTHSNVKTLFFHPLLHTAKIFLFLFALSLFINLIVARVGEEKIGALLLNGSFFQPVLASLIGSIPNCFASVLLADFFAKGAISFGSLVAGLSAGAGLGVLVLARENKDVKDTITLVALLLAVSMASGILIQLLAKI